MPQFFIHRPVFAWVIALFIVLAGVIAIILHILIGASLVDTLCCNYKVSCWRQSSC